MPFVVGKKAACADGTAVRFDVTGPEHDARAFTIAVEAGRARPGGRRGGTDGDLSLSASTSCALAAGGPPRRGGGEGGLGVAGDASVGRSVLSAMNFMF